MDENLMEKYLGGEEPDYGALHPAFAQLTPRQQEIMRLIGDGKSTADIAQITGLSQRTVGFHRSNIRKVLGIDSELGLARQAMLFRMAEDQAPGA